MDVVRRIDAMDRFLISQFAHMDADGHGESTRQMANSLLATISSAHLTLDDATTITDRVGATVFSEDIKNELIGAVHARGVAIIQDHSSVSSARQELQLRAPRGVWEL